MPDLPSFNKPPVVEVVMGVQFNRLEKFNLPYFGRFWSTIEPDYTSCRETPLLIPQIEDPNTPVMQRVRVGLSQTPQLPRVFFEHSNQQWVIQLQRDRFVFNWRKDELSPYPRYPAVKKQFFSQWKNFQEFVAKYELGEIKVIQLEITYLNQIRGIGDETMIGEIFPDIQWRSDHKFLSQPESIGFSGTFVHVGSKSRLRVNIEPGFTQDGNKLFQFELTVRGAPADDNFDRWFDDGRLWIVNAFTDLTSEGFHMIWEREP